MPNALRASVGKREMKISLGTANVDEAKRLAEAAALAERAALLLRHSTADAEETVRNDRSCVFGAVVCTSVDVPYEAVAGGVSTANDPLPSSVDLYSPIRRGRSVIFF